MRLSRPPLHLSLSQFTPSRGLRRPRTITTDFGAGSSFRRHRGRFGDARRGGDFQKELVARRRHRRRRVRRRRDVVDEAHNGRLRRRRLRGQRIRRRRRRRPGVMRRRLRPSGARLDAATTVGAVVTRAGDASRGVVVVVNDGVGTLQPGVDGVGDVGVHLSRQFRRHGENFGGVEFVAQIAEFLVRRPLKGIQFETLGEVFDGLDESFGLEADAAEEVEDVGGAVGVFVGQRVDEARLQGRREKQRLFALGEPFQIEAGLGEEEPTSGRLGPRASRLEEMVDAERLARAVQTRRQQPNRVVRIRRLGHQSSRQKDGVFVVVRFQRMPDGLLQRFPKYHRRRRRRRLCRGE